VDAPNPKRNLTTSLWPCWAAKNRAVVPDWERRRDRGRERERFKRHLANFI
jgi:hypothetical protein